jgi:hypothetical protein
MLDFVPFGGQGKRKWPDDLRYRYTELVNSIVNT